MADDVARTADLLGVPAPQRPDTARAATSGGPAGAEAAGA
jgi:hypothetical protein